MVEHMFDPEEIDIPTINDRTKSLIINWGEYLDKKNTLTEYHDRRFHDASSDDENVTSIIIETMTPLHKKARMTTNMQNKMTKPQEKLVYSSFKLQKFPEEKLNNNLQHIDLSNNQISELSLE